MFGAAIQPSHFGTMVIFALLVSVAFACIGHRTFATRIKYALFAFLLFLIIGVGVAWLMFPLSR